MHIIGQKRFVIEGKFPLSFGNKIERTDQGDVIVPDGETKYEYLWFCGVGAHPDHPGLIGPVWSPYPEQGFKYKDWDEANAVNALILGPDAGGYVMDWDLCNKAMGRQVFVPIANTSIEEATSQQGIRGGKMQ